MSVLAPVICTAAVTHGSATVQVTGTDASTGVAPVLSTINCGQDALVALGGAAYLVGAATPIDTTHFTLERVYEGSTGTVTCTISPVTPEMTQRITLLKNLQIFSAQAALIAANSAGLSYIYTGATSAPLANQLSLNNVSPASATLITFNNTDLNNQVISDRLLLMKTGDVLNLRAMDGSARVTLKATGNAALSGSVTSVAVSYVGASGVLAAGAQIVVERDSVGLSGNNGANGILTGIETVETASFSLFAANIGGTFIANSASAIACNLDTSAHLGTPWAVLIKNIGAGVLTIAAASGETIDGAATITVAPNASLLLSRVLTGTGLRTSLNGIASIPANSITGNNGGSAGPEVALTITQILVMLKPIVRIKTTTFTSSGSWTPDAALVHAMIEVQAPGGGGGGCSASGSVGSVNGGGGGEGGEFSRAILATATIGTSPITVTIGAVGTGGAAGANNGGTGGTTSVGTLVTAIGGVGGTGTTGAGAGGQSAQGGTNSLSHGSPGSSGISEPALNINGGVFGGAGGNSMWGSGAKSTTSPNNGAAGFGFGGGGAGGTDFNNAAARTGGNGAPGKVIISEYCYS